MRSLLAYCCLVLMRLCTLPCALRGIGIVPLFYSEVVCQHSEYGQYAPACVILFGCRRMNPSPSQCSVSFPFSYGGGGCGRRRGGGRIAPTHSSFAKTSALRLFSIYVLVERPPTGIISEVAVHVFLFARTLMWFMSLPPRIPLFVGVSVFNGVYPRTRLL